MEVKIKTEKKKRKDLTLYLHLCSKLLARGSRNEKKKKEENQKTTIYRHS